MADTIKSGADEISLTFRVIAFPDKPGIAKVYLGDSVVFEANGQRVTDLTLRAAMPFHIHFVAPELSMSLAWTEEPLT